MPRVTAVILAAGLGTRMQSAIPKVLHPVAHRPMIHHLIMTVETALREEEEMSIAVVIGPEMPALAAAVAPHSPVVQAERRGTGHAVQMALPLMPQTGTILILMGDTPLLRPETIRRLIATQRSEGAAIVLGAFRPTNPSGFGRIFKAEDGSVTRIVEERDLTPDQKEISLCNSGLYAVEANCLPGLLARLTRNNAQDEFYLTDIIAHAVSDGALVRALEFPAEEAQGVNSRADLALVESLAQARYRRQALDNGASLLDPGSVYFAADTLLGRDVTIGPHVVFGPGVRIADRVTIHAFSHIEGAVIASGASIGPFARLRPGARLEESVHIGNFVEIKNTTLGPGAKANHLAYLGDADIGAGSNIGAGTITCNYDGINKHRTIIGENAFIGSNSALVAPVIIGDGALVGAGSVITRNVPANAITVVRGGLTQKEGAAKSFRKTRLKTSMDKKD